MLYLGIYIPDPRVLYVQSHSDVRYNFPLSRPLYMIALCMSSTSDRIMLPEHSYRTKLPYEKLPGKATVPRPRARACAHVTRVQIGDEKKARPREGSSFVRTK
jgi:hypothetical protein